MMSQKSILRSSYTLQIPGGGQAPPLAPAADALGHYSSDCRRKRHAEKLFEGCPYVFQIAGLHLQSFLSLSPI